MFFVKDFNTFHDGLRNGGVIEKVQFSCSNSFKIVKVFLEVKFL